MKKSIRNILRTLLLILCGGILGVNVYLINANNLVGDQLPMPFGYGAAVVLSGSMEPTLSVDDLILVKEQESYSLGDVVVFQDVGSLVVHRIVHMEDDTIITQGDANNVSDAPIPFSAVKGRVILSIPYAGIIVNFIKTPVGTLCIIAAAIALVEIPRRREKRKDDEERQKILEEIKKLREES